MQDRFPIFAALDREWCQFARSTAATAALTRWRTLEPAFAGFDHVDDVLAARLDRDRADEILDALTARAGRDEAAARVVLQAIIPGLVRLAASFDRGDPATTASDVVAIAWERIRTFPTHRTRAIASNLLLDVRKRLLADRKHLDLTSVAAETSPSAEDEALANMVIDDLVKAESAGVIARGATELIVKTRVDGHPVVELAARGAASRPTASYSGAVAENRLHDHLAVA